MCKISGRNATEVNNYLFYFSKPSVPLFISLIFNGPPLCDCFSVMNELAWRCICEERGGKSVEMEILVACLYVNNVILFVGLICTGAHVRRRYHAWTTNKYEKINVNI